MGKREHVINYMFFVAEEVREIMAELGVRTVNELIGHVDLLEFEDTSNHFKAKHLDLSVILHKPEAPSTMPFALHNVEKQKHGLENSLHNNRLIPLAQPAIDKDAKVF